MRHRRRFGPLVWRGLVVGAAALALSAPVALAGPPALAFGTASTLPGADVAIAYTSTILATGGTAPFTFRASGSLSPGIAVASSGVVSGTSFVAGVYTFSVTVADATSSSANENLTLVVAPPPEITLTALGRATVGAAYSANVSAGGGTAPLQFALSSGALPPGLVLAATTGAISGTPASAGTSSFSISVTDANAAVATAGFSITVSGALGAVGSVATLQVPSFVPSAPGAVNAVALSGSIVADSALVSWNTPTSTGGSPIVSYSLVPFDVTTATAAAPVSAPAVSTSATVGSLAAGDVYTFTVAGVNLAGTGTTSAASNAIVPVAAKTSSSHSASSNSATSTVKVSVGTTATSAPLLTAKATGAGTLTVASFATDPVPALSTSGTYWDVAIAPTSTFTSLEFTLCQVTSGALIEWWDPETSALEPVSNQTKPTGSRSCATVSVLASTSPSISDLYGTVFTAGRPPPGGLVALSASGATVTVGTTLTGSLHLPRITPGLPAPNLASSAAVGIARTPDGKGYFIASASGSVFVFGKAKFHGSLRSNHRLPSAPIVGIAGTADGNGYWLAASNGTVYSFGDAKPYGSARAASGAPVVGIASTPDGKGYVLAARSGAAYRFGDAVLGWVSASGSTSTPSPVVGIAMVPDGRGCVMAEQDGAVLMLGDATSDGALAGSAAKQAGPIAGIASTPDGRGYWLVARSGQVYAFGSATPYRSVAASRKLAVTAISAS